MATPMIVIIRNSWIVIWISIEINNLSFTSLKLKKKEYRNEAGLKYFLIQRITSTLFIVIMISTTEKISIIKTMIITIILIKIAAAPMHQWFIEITKTIEVTQLTLAITWQKVIPLLMLIYTNRKIITAFIISTTALGALIQIKIKNSLEIIGASSVFNNGWSIAMTKTSITSLATFTIIYWYTVITTIMIIKKLKTEKFTETWNNQENKWVINTAISNTGRLPPTAGFSAKVWAISTIIKKKLTVISIMLTSITAINLYSYIKIIINNLIKNTPTKIKNKFSNTKITEISIVSILTIIIVSQ
jgi:NADH:ubiquinone oxidoreductase subunit 2 (subunit N)